MLVYSLSFVVSGKGTERKLLAEQADTFLGDEVSVVLHLPSNQVKPLVAGEASCTREALFAAAAAVTQLLRADSPLVPPRVASFPLLTTGLDSKIYKNCKSKKEIRPDQTTRAALAVCFLLLLRCGTSRRWGRGQVVNVGVVKMC